VSGEVVVLGVGNLLAGDDGIGVHVVQALREGRPGQGLGDGVRVVDGGTMGLELLPLIGDARAVVLVDAVELGLAPGSVRVLEGEAVRGVMAHAMSAHQVGVSDLIALGHLTGMLPGYVVLVGVQPATMGMTLELSAPVQRAIPDTLRAVRAAVAAVPPR
jgi:hydrogenase maturation protease